MIGLPSLPRSVTSTPPACRLSADDDRSGMPTVGVLELEAGPLVAIVEEHLDAAAASCRESPSRRASRPLRAVQGEHQHVERRDHIGQ